MTAPHTFRTAIRDSGGPWIFALKSGVTAAVLVALLKYGPVGLVILAAVIAP